MPSGSDVDGGRDSSLALSAEPRIGGMAIASIDYLCGWLRNWLARGYCELLYVSSHSKSFELPCEVIPGEADSFVHLAGGHCIHAEFGSYDHQSPSTPVVSVPGLIL